MKKIVSLGIATLAVVTLVGAGAVSVSALAGNGQGLRNGAGNPANTQRGGGYQSSIESRAKVLGMTSAELQKALETKTMSQIAVERGMDETTFRSKMGEAAKARWEARGLSDEEIAKRVADREKRHAENRADHEFGSGAGNHMGGYGRNR